MRFAKPLSAAALVAAVIVSGRLAAADEAATTMPTSAPTITRPMTKSGKPRALRLVKPWSDVSDLSEDQKIQIFTIHEDTKDKISALMEEEQSKCMALLTDSQKAELNDTMGAKAAAAKKADAK